MSTLRYAKVDKPAITTFTNVEIIRANSDARGDGTRFKGSANSAC